MEKGSATDRLDIVICPGGGDAGAELTRKAEDEDVQSAVKVGPAGPCPFGIVEAEFDGAHPAEEVLSGVDVGFHLGAGGG